MHRFNLKKITYSDKLFNYKLLKIYQLNFNLVSNIASLSGGSLDQ